MAHKMSLGNANSDCSSLDIILCIYIARLSLPHRQQLLFVYMFKLSFEFNRIAILYEFGQVEFNINFELTWKGISKVIIDM